MKTLKQSLLLPLLAISCSVMAEDAAREAIEKSLSKVVEAKPESINTTQVNGVYEVKYGNKYYYVSSDGRYLFMGDMIDLQTQKNLTETRRSDGRKQLVASMNADEMIIYKAKGKEKHVINVFTDIDCGYCRKLHSGMDDMNELGITVRYLAYPRAGIGSNSFKKSVSVWCAEDQMKAMNSAKKTGTVDEFKNCENPVVEHMILGQKLGVTGTPAIVLSDGTLIPGYQPPKQLLQTLEN